MRLAKGTGLNLGQVATAVLGQIATVPIYLSYWDAQTYGVWLIMQGMVSYLSLLSEAFQQYSYGEVLRRGSKAHDAVHTLYRTSLAVAFLIALGEFGAILALAPAAAALALPDTMAEATSSLVSILILFGILNLATVPFGAITSQTMTIHGYFPALAASGLLRTASSLFAPAIAVALGADLWTAGLVLIGSHAVPAALSLVYWAHLARRYGLLAPKPIDWRMGARNFLLCLPLAGRGFIESFRQQGFRIFLGNYLGMVSVTKLATTRTFANMLYQGLTSITAPLLPELMRYVVNRDQDRVEGAFAIVWLYVFALLVPGVLILCAVAEPVFLIWTRGTVGFDGVLFLCLLIVVLLYAAGQPAAAILQGHNRIITMFSAAVAAALALAVLAATLVPSFELRGAGYALIGAELCAMIVTVFGARRLLREAGLAFPLRSFGLVLGNIATVSGLSFLVVTVMGGKAVLFLLPLAASAVFTTLYWKTIPALARERIAELAVAMRSWLLRSHTT